LGDQRTISGGNNVWEPQGETGVRFRQIGKYQAIRFAARFNAAMRRQCDLVD
jgi:hypothetical protein